MVAWSVGSGAGVPAVPVRDWVAEIAAERKWPVARRSGRGVSGAGWFEGLLRKEGGMLRGVMGW